MTCFSRINISRSYTEGRGFESHLELHASHSFHVIDLFIHFPVLCYYYQQLESWGYRRSLVKFPVKFQQRNFFSQTKIFHQFFQNISQISCQILAEKFFQSNKNLPSLVNGGTSAFSNLLPNLTEKTPSQIFTVLYPKDFAIFKTICITYHAIFMNISLIVKTAE